MPRVPLPIVLLLCIAVVAGVWWHGTRDYDFLTPPSAAQIELTRMRAAGELAQPSDLFAVEPVEETSISDIPPPAPPPEPPAPVPVIEPGDLSAEPRLDAWTDQAGKPAASFINLASHLESDTQLGWALLGWERVIDHTEATPDELASAINAVRRLRATVPPWNEDPKQSVPVILTVEAPGDRLKLTGRAAKIAAEIIGEASSGIVSVSALVRKGRETAAAPRLRTTLAGKDIESPPSVETPAPESEEEIRDAIIASVFKLVGSGLALSEELRPLSFPPPEEEPAETLNLRVTRLAWEIFAQSNASP